MIDSQFYFGIFTASCKDTNTVTSLWLNQVSVKRKAVMKSVISNRVIGLCAIVLGLMISSCQTAKVGEQAPKISGKLIDGSSFDLSDLKGKYVVLHFWGSWCGPCLRENPMLVKLEDKFGDRVEFVTVALEKNDRMWKRAADKAGFDWKYQIIDQTPMVLASKNARAYGVADIPATFIINPDGSLMSQFHLGQVDEVLKASLAE
jgi:thiol-disulfide isomerase/thioredoxin